MSRGLFKYNPKEVIDELNITKNMFSLGSDADAYRKMVENARIGREIRFRIEFNFVGRKK